MAILKVANVHFDAAGTTRLQANGANVLTIVTGNAEDARFDASGNLLISRTNSTVGQGVKLDINGAINASAVLINGASVLATSNSYTVTVGTAGNAYAQAVGTAGNTYAQAVGTGGNNYTITVGAAANGWANTISSERAAASNGWANTISSERAAASNGWANTISATRSTASNTYAETVGTAGNVYAREVGTAGNAYTVTVGTAGNNYSVTVGAAANGWSNTKLSNTSGISFNGNLTVPGEFTVGGNLIFDTTTATRIWEPAVNTIAIITTQTERARIDSTGNVLIGRTDSTVGLGVKLDVNGAVNTSALYVNGAPITGGATVTTDSVNATRYIVFEDSTSGTMTLANVSTSLTFNPSTGTLSSTVFNSTSDETLKYNVQPIDNALGIVDQINGVSFTWKESGLPSLGVIAQDIEKVLPELVGTDGKNKTVNYNGIIAVLIEAVKELSKRVEELKRR